MSKPGNVPEIRRRLEYIAGRLRRVRDTSPDGVSQPLEHWAADAIERFLSDKPGSPKSLDEAFGLVLTGKRGAKPRPETLERARRAYELAEQGVTQEKVAAEIGKSVTRTKELIEIGREYAELVAMLDR